jgi:hypothetical protein
MGCYQNTYGLTSDRSRRSSGYKYNIQKFWISVWKKKTKLNIFIYFLYVVIQLMRPPRDTRFNNQQVRSVDDAILNCQIFNRTQDALQKEAAERQLISVSPREICFIFQKNKLLILLISFFFLKIFIKYVLSTFTHCWEASKCALWPYMYYF